MALVNLVLSSDKHLNHLLAYVEGVRFGPEWIHSQMTTKVQDSGTRFTLVSLTH